MVRADIRNGDYVVVRQQQVAESGDIVVALLGESE
jgi:SOS-response transcriptional repressor LexA